jgi:hypothetical protein
MSKSVKVKITKSTFKYVSKPTTKQGRVPKPSSKKR